LLPSKSSIDSLPDGSRHSERRTADTARRISGSRQTRHRRTLGDMTIAFEFRVSVVGPDWLTASKGDDATRELNTLGEEGWQLAAVFSHPGDASVSVILQRPISN
jgi:hypothetical protein